MTKKIAPEPLPTEQTLEQVYEYERAKRSTLGGIANAAMGGDRAALKRFAGSAVAFVDDAARREPNGQIAELAEWLAYALSRIQSGEEPNAAFGWSKPAKGRPSARNNMDELRKRYMIGNHMAGLLANAPDMSEAEAQRLVKSDHDEVSIESVRNYWEQWQGKKIIK